MPIVEAKVRSLPGGEDFLEAFADKKQLIALDRKMQNGEDLTKEELEFLYEFNRPIKSLDTYNDEDPRIYELREKYGLDYALKQGVDPKQIVYNLDTISAHHVDIDINDLVPKLDPDFILGEIEKLIAHGTDIDLNELASKASDNAIIINYDYLVLHGVEPDHAAILFNLLQDPRVKRHECANIWERIAGPSYTHSWSTWKRKTSSLR